MNLLETMIIGEIVLGVPNIDNNSIYEISSLS